MEPVNVSIRIETPEVRPGEPIRGRVTFRAAEPWQVKRAHVMLYWLARNDKSDSDGVSTTEVLLEPGSEASPSLERQFTITAPVMPWSYDGKLFKITWYVAATAHARGAKARTEEVEVAIRRA